MITREPPQTHIISSVSCELPLGTLASNFRPSRELTDLNLVAPCKLTIRVLLFVTHDLLLGFACVTLAAVTRDPR
jgi:hypothetical protein